MSKRAERPQSPRHILVFDEDWEFLEQTFGKTGVRPIGVSVAIRKIIHQKVGEIRAELIRRVDAAQVAE